MDSNHDIVPTLRMFDGMMMGKAADEIEALRKRNETLTGLLESVRVVCQRNGQETAWARLDTIIAKQGIGAITARTFRILPSDLEPPAMTRYFSKFDSDEIGDSVPCITNPTPQPFQKRYLTVKANAEAESTKEQRMAELAKTACNHIVGLQEWRICSEKRGFATYAAQRAKQCPFT